MKHTAASAQLSLVCTAGWVSGQIWILRKAKWSLREVVLSLFFMSVQDIAGQSPGKSDVVSKVILF